jgi:hypothetical protein
MGNSREMRRGCNKTTYKIIGCKVLAVLVLIRRGDRERERESKMRVRNLLARSLSLFPLPHTSRWRFISRVRESRSRKFRQIFYCVTIFMVIVIINCTSLFIFATRHGTEGKEMEGEPAMRRIRDSWIVA